MWSNCSSNSGLMHERRSELLAHRMMLSVSAGRERDTRDWHASK